MHRCLLIFFFIGAVCEAALLPESQREDLSRAVLKNFWGNAKLSNGDFVQPSSESERHTPPVSNSVANRALDAGEISGLGEWCKLDWKSHYFSMTTAARSMGMADKQIAFVSFLHGAAQERMFSTMAKTSSCDEQYRGKVQRMLDQSEVRGFAGM